MQVLVFALGNYVIICGLTRRNDFYTGNSMVYPSSETYGFTFLMRVDSGLHD
jgi:hypothetical protein